jgi:hypothetical protein
MKSYSLDDPKKTVQDLLLNYRSQSLFLTELSDKRSEISAIASDSFAEQKNFQRQWQAFNDVLADYFVSDAFLEKFAQANDLGKLAATAVMARFVESFDLSIKAIKGSSAYEVNQEIANVHEMLKRYAEVFKRWITLVKEGSIVYNDNGGQLHNFIKAIDTVLEKKVFTKKDLDATPGLNASAFTIGSGLNIIDYEPKPNTLEDIFTIIHQCLLVTLSALNANAGIAGIEKPTVVINAETMLKSISINGRSFSLIGLDLKNDAMTLDYNLPLQNHSIQVSLRYDRKKKNAVLTTKFFGHGAPRWYVMQTFVEVVRLINRMPVLDNNATDNGAVFSLQFDKDVDTNDLREVIQQAIDITFKQSFSGASMVSGLPVLQQIEVAQQLLKKIGSAALKVLALDIAYNNREQDAGKELIKTLLATSPPIYLDSQSAAQLLSLIDYAVEKNLVDDFTGLIHYLYVIWQGNMNSETYEQIVRTLDAIGDKKTAKENFITKIGDEILAIKAKRFHSDVGPNLILTAQEQGSEKAFYSLITDQGANLIQVQCKKGGDAPCSLSLDWFGWQSPQSVMYARLYAMAQNWEIDDVKMDMQAQRSHLTLRLADQIKPGALTEFITKISGDYRLHNSLENLADNVAPNHLIRAIELILNREANALDDYDYRTKVFPYLIKSEEGLKLFETILSQLSEDRADPMIGKMLEIAPRLDANTLARATRFINQTMADKEKSFGMRIKITAALIANPEFPTSTQLISTVIDEALSANLVDDLVLGLLNTTSYFNTSKKGKFFEAVKGIYERLIANGGVPMKEKGESKANSLVGSFSSHLMSKDETRTKAIDLFQLLVNDNMDPSLLAYMIASIFQYKNDEEIKPLWGKILRLANAEPYKSNESIQQQLRQWGL